MSFLCKILTGDRTRARTGGRVLLQRERGHRGGASGRRPLALRLLRQHQRRRAEDQELVVAVEWRPID